ncbi:unnamed protein product [Closterium sp. NIES-64]|nr:unnamed protein product [Closterium sp. NIES-64]
MRESARYWEGMGVGMITIHGWGRGATPVSSHPFGRYAYDPSLSEHYVCMAALCSAPVRFFYCTDADGKVHKAVPCLYGYLADFPESSRASATLQQGSHRPCANCYAVKGELTMMVGKCDPRTLDEQRDIVRQILACKKKGEADDVRKLWSTHPIEVCLLVRGLVVRNEGALDIISSANYAAFEHRSMMQIMPLLVADESALKDGPEGELRALQVKAFRLHLLDNVKERGMPHHYSTEMWERTHKGMVKGPVRGSNWSDIPRRIMEEEVQREVYREVAADAGGGRQYARALREVHTAVAIPRTRGRELVAKGTFVKASPRERWYSDVALLNDKGGDWYAKCLCIFRAVDREGDWKGYAYVRYYEKAGSCKLTGCTQLHKTVEDVRFSVVELKSLQRVVHVCPSYSNKKVQLVNSRLPKSYIPDKRNVVERIISVGILYNATGSCSAVPLVVLEPSNRPLRRRASAASRKVAVSRDRNTIILTIHNAHRITGEVAPAVSEHGFSVQHLTNTRVVNIRGSVPETGLPHLQGVGDALKVYYRVMLMRRAIGSKRFQFDYSASIADVDYNDILEWLGEAWTHLLIEKFKERPACYMTASDFINCDAGIRVEQGFRATPDASASDDSSGDMSLPDGPLLRDERSRRRVIRNVTNAYVERADELGIPPAAVPAEVGASNQEVISRLCRTPVKRARAGGRAENATAEEVLQSDEVLESDDDQ